MRMRRGLVAIGLSGALTFGAAPVAGAVGEAPPPDAVPAQTDPAAADEGGSGSWGLLGLLGLAGLLGLRGRKDRTADPEGRRSFGDAMVSSTSA